MDSGSVGSKWHTKAVHETFEAPENVMEDFAKWLSENSRGRPIFISDNPAFDWQWINWYLHTYPCKNPFGFSARRIGDLYCGMKNGHRLKCRMEKIIPQNYTRPQLGKRCKRKCRSFTGNERNGIENAVKLIKKWQMHFYLGD